MDWWLFGQIKAIALIAASVCWTLCTVSLLGGIGFKMCLVCKKYITKDKEALKNKAIKSSLLVD